MRNLGISPIQGLLFLVLLSYSCKTARIVPSQSEPDNRDTIQETTEVDTLLIDTLAIADSADSFPQIQTPEKPDTITFTAVGDIMMGTNFPDPKYLPPNRGRHLLDSVRPYLVDSDVTFGNLEGVILDEGGTPKYCKNPDVCYLFRSPTYYVQYLKEAGFDVVSMANNHAGDFGDEGRQSTMDHLDSVGIHYAGLETHPYTLFSIDSVTFGMIAFAPNTGTVNINDTTRAKELVMEVDSLCDILIVSFHGGAEGKDHRHVTRETETYYGENRGNVYAFSHMLIDHGADLILGHGPHVTRAIELYNDRLIAYSLGNFCTYARFNLRGPNGMAPILKVRTDNNGKFINGNIIPIIQVGAGIPIIDPQKRVILEIQNLISTDFPESKIRISNDGEIIRKNKIH
jgi:poly-gamma-glutamate capsule biosynthesis protein CapA/YwtB (metallophosphatase superfamily)